MIQSQCDRESVDLAMDASSYTIPLTDVTLAMQMMLEVVMGVMDTDVDKVAGMDEMDEN